jgi:UDP-2,3-diacylglucosamine hydrolase
MPMNKPFIKKEKEPVTYFVADLHLSQNTTDITECFVSFLKDEAVHAQTLYILGDLFESWIGDDDDSPFVETIASALLALTKTGTCIYYIHGNRDFLIGKKYAKRCGMTLLPEVILIDLYGQASVIMHGDTLCTRDVSYQKFRKKSRSWWWQTIIKTLPLTFRRNKAEEYRKKSAEATSIKSQDIMDVTPSEVVKCLEEYRCQWLIHGHTHRPFVHNLIANDQSAKRIVLGDWYEQGAWLKVDASGYTLMNKAF